jgi:hypothetical protein
MCVMLCVSVARNKFWSLIRTYPIFEFVNSCYNQHQHDAILFNDVFWTAQFVHRLMVELLRTGN